MNIIFLDIDGVLNNYHLNKPFNFKNGTVQEPVIGTQTKWNGIIGMDYKKVEKLNNLMEELENWSIIISSSWGFSTNTIQALQKFGFKYNHRIVGGTGYGNGRGNQIWNVVKAYKRINHIITIEDEPFDILGEHSSVTNDMRIFFKNKVFSPNPYIGLTDELVKKIIEYCKGL